MATKKGRPILDKLINSPFKNVYIDDVFLASKSTYDWQGLRGRRNTVYYPLSVWWSVRETAYVNSYIILGHEINHAYDHFLNRDLYDKDTRERSSVYFGNYLRSVYEKSPLRKKYPGLTYGKHKFSQNETVYNKDIEKVTDFTEIDNFENSNIVVKGFSYNSVTKNMSSPTSYILSYTINKEYKYKQFDNFENYKFELDKLIKSK